MYQVYVSRQLCAKNRNICELFIKNNKIPIYVSTVNDYIKF